MMTTRFLGFLLLTFLPTGPCFSETRILVVGDSWAAGVFHFQAFPQVLANHEVEGVEVYGLKTAIGGSRADQWASNHKGKLDALISELADHPDVEIVHLSVGGNDFLSYCSKTDISKATPEARAAKWNSICSDIEKIVRHLLAQRPDLRVLLCDYDFLDPERIAQTYGRGTKGSPSLQEVNEALVELATRKLELTRSIDRCEFVPNYGLMQYHFGIPEVAEPKTVPFPGKAPDYEPFPGGNLDYASGDAMPDGVHPIPQGYVLIIENCFEQFYGDWLKKD